MPMFDCAVVSPVGGVGPGLGGDGRVYPENHYRDKNSVQAFLPWSLKDQKRPKSNALIFAKLHLAWK